MQISAQEFLPLVERAGALAFFDIESTGTHGDYNSVLVVSVKPWHEKAIVLAVKRPGEDKSLVTRVRDLLLKYTVWVSYYGKMFDAPMLQSRLLHHHCKPLDKRHHVDMYWVLRGRVLTSRRSQAHLLEWLDTPQKKMTLSPELWNLVLRNPTRGLRTLRQRCESDTIGLEALYDASKHLIAEIQR